MSYTLFLFLAVHNKRSPIIQEEELLKAMISPQYRQIDKTYEKAFFLLSSHSMPSFSIILSRSACFF